jgi:hypothetical protein
MTYKNDELANGDSFFICRFKSTSIFFVFYHLAFLQAYHGLHGDLACSMLPSQRPQCQIEGCQELR